MQERTFVDAHEVEVGSTWWPVDGARAIVVISHGASEHGRRYDRFASALNEAGFAAVAIDHRGHGRTGKATGVGVVGAGGGAAIVDDLHELRAAASAELGPDLPVLFFGHSLGSLIGLGYLTRHSAGLAGAVLCGIPADVDGIAGLAELLQGAADAGMADETFDLSGNNAPFEPARTRFDWLSRDEAEVDAYVADPYCGDENPITYRYLTELFDVVAPTRDRFAAISCPVRVIVGDQDPSAGMGTYATILDAALRAAGVDVSTKIYEGARHELLNETNRDEVTADLVAWFDSRL